MQRLLAYLCFVILLTPTGVFALAEKPDYSNPKETSQQEGDADLDLEFEQPVNYVDSVNVTNENQTSGVSGTTINPADMTDEMLDNIDKYDSLMKQKQFDKAREQILLIPNNALTQKQKKDKATLAVFHQISLDEAENIRQFGKDESMDPDDARSVKRLQREAKALILNDNKDLARDTLIQSLYIDRKNFVSKQLLERNLDLPLGSYTVENIEAKYWKNSQIFLYSGQPLQAVDNLKVLANFDPENESIFERMGSAYYMSGQPKEAINAWKRALYLNPDNKTLETFIKNAEVEVKKQEDATKAFVNRKKKKKTDAAKGQDMQTLRIVADSNTAYSYAQEVRQQMPGINVVVEEMEDGKWAVKIPSTKKEKK